MHVIAANHVPVHSPAAELQLYRQIRHLEMELGKSNSVRELCAALADGMKQLTGFDRVCVCQLTGAGEAEIVAETRQPHLRSLLGGSFPATSLTLPGLQLAMEQRVSVFEGLDTAIGSATHIDSRLWQDCVDHFGRGAVLAVKILQHGSLWGVIVCHHSQPRSVPPAVIEGCEFLGERVALQLTIREKLEQVRAENELRQRHLELVSSLASPDAESWLNQLGNHGDKLMALVAATGAALVHGNQVRLLGETPGMQAVHSLARWLRNGSANDVFASDNVAPEIPGLHECSNYSVLAVKVSHQEGSYLIWFRHVGTAHLRASRLTHARANSPSWSSLDRLAAELMHSSLVGVLLEAVALRHAVTELELFRIRQAVEASSEAIAVLDRDRQVVFVNAAFHHLFGAAKQASEGEWNWATLFEDATVANQIFDGLKTGAAWNGEVVLRNDSGQMLPVHVRFNAIDDGQQRTGFIGLFTDLTERRRMEQQLQQAQKLESLGVLAGGIAHDFNNLLTGILGFAGLVRQQLPTTSAATEGLLSIELAAQRAGDLCKQLLAYAGKGRFVVEAIDLNEILQEMAQLLATVLPKTVQLRLEFASHLPPVMGDATQIRQVVMNLITNGADAITAREGTVAVRTTCVKAGSHCLDEYSFWSSRRDDRYVCLEVADTGHGMDAETLARIFDPFFTTKFTGRGLGLAAVQGILRGHQGGIHVTSQPGQGTTFRILLPACQAQENTPRRPDGSPSLTGGDRLILVVDDEDAVRVVASRALELAGFRVLAATNGREAVEIFRAQGDRIAAVLLDWTMPHWGGAETLQELRQLSPNVRVVLCSGFSEEEITRRVPGGLSAFIQKPFRINHLLGVVSQVLAGSRLVIGQQDWFATAVPDAREKCGT